MATIAGDITHITDEDLLRRMWQQAEDFSRKKEIRAHMYKLREQRLKEFYTSGEVLRDVQRSNSSPGLRDKKTTRDTDNITEQTYTKSSQYTRRGDSGLTHADSLTDQSFLSLKSKEVRDSESPTREISYRAEDMVKRGDNNWRIITTNETSKDGKDQVKSQLATTSGIKEIDGGVGKFAALNEEQVFERNDGDERTYGGSTRTSAQEQFVSGDENNFRTSSSKTTSSSSHVVKHYGSSAPSEVDIDEYQSRGRKDIQVTRDTKESGNRSRVTSQEVKTTDENSILTSRVVQNYKSDDPNLPDYAKNNIVNGTTTIITEIRELPDGTTVTKTKYSTVGPTEDISSYTQKTRHDSAQAQINRDEKSYTNKNTTQINRDEKSYTNKNSQDTIQINRDVKSYTDKNRQDSTYTNREDTSCKKNNQEDDLLTIRSNIRITTTPCEDRSTSDFIDSEKQNLRETRRDRSTSRTRDRDVSPIPQEPVDKNHYQTTYRKEYTSKRITVDTSAQHDAFAKSLRTSPERISPHRRVSPEKSPTRRFGSNDTITLTDRRSPYSSPYTKSPRESPERKQAEHQPKEPTPRESIYTTDYCTDTIKKRRLVTRYDSPVRSRETSPTKSSEPYANRSTPRGTAWSPTRDAQPRSRGASPTKSSKHTPSYTQRCESPRKSPSKETPSYAKPLQREVSPRKSPSKESPSSVKPLQRDVSPRKSPSKDSPSYIKPLQRDISPRKLPNKETPRADSPTKSPRETSYTRPFERDISPRKSPTKETPQASFPAKSSRETTTRSWQRDLSPCKTPVSENLSSPRTSPSKETPSYTKPLHRDDVSTRKSPSKPQDEGSSKLSRPWQRDVSPRKSPTKDIGTPTQPHNRDASPTKRSPSKTTPSPDVEEIGVREMDTNTFTRKTQKVTEEVTTETNKRKTSGGILKNARRPSDDYVRPNTMVTDLDSNVTITISEDQTDCLSRPSSLDLKKPIGGFTSPTDETAQPAYSPTKSSKQPKERAPLRRKDTYGDKCAELLGLIPKNTETVEPVVTTHKVVKKDKADFPEDMGNPIQEFPAQRRSPSPERHSKPTKLSDKMMVPEYFPTPEVRDVVDTEVEIISNNITNETFVTCRESPERTAERDSTPSQMEDKKAPYRNQRKSPEKSPEKDLPNKAKLISEKPETESFTGRKSSLKKTVNTQDFIENLVSTEVRDRNNRLEKSPTPKPIPKETKIDQETCTKQPSIIKTNEVTTITTEKIQSSSLKEPLEDVTEKNVRQKPKKQKSPDSSPERSSATKNITIQSEKVKPRDNEKRAQKSSPESPAEVTTITKQILDNTPPFKNKKTRSPNSSPERVSTKTSVETTTIEVEETKQGNKSSEPEPRRRLEECSPERHSITRTTELTTITTEKDQNKSKAFRSRSPELNPQVPTKITEKVITYGVRELKPEERQPSPESSPDRSTSIKTTEISSVITEKKPKQNERLSKSPESSPERPSSTRTTEIITVKEVSDQPSECRPVNTDEKLKSSQAKAPKPESETSKVTTIITKKTSVSPQSSPKPPPTVTTTETITIETGIISPQDKETKPEKQTPRQPSKPVKSSPSEFSPDYTKRTPSDRFPQSSSEKPIHRATKSTKPAELKKSTIKKPTQTLRKPPGMSTSEFLSQERITSNETRTYEIYDSSDESDSSGTLEEAPTKTQPRIQHDVIRTTKVETTKKITKAPSVPRQTSPVKKPLPKQQSAKELSTKRVPEPSPDRKSKIPLKPDIKTQSFNLIRNERIQKSPQKAPIKTITKQTSAKELTGKVSPVKKSPEVKKTVTTTITISPTKSAPKKTEPKTTVKVTTKPLPRRHTDDALGKPKSKPTMTTAKSVSSVTKTTKEVVIKARTIPKLDDTCECDHTTEDESDFDLLDNLDYTNDVSVTENFKTMINQTKTFRSDVKIQPKTKHPTTQPNDNKRTPIKKKPDIKIATKTINLGTAMTTEQFVVDIQQSKSSREPSTEHIWPCPVPNNTDSGKPRHPDNVTEPDDYFQKPKLTNLKEDETSDDTITDVTDDYIPRSITMTDDCLMSVTDKVNKFISEAEKLVSTKKEAAPKVARPEFEVDESLRNDECILSVSDKVNKFIITAEESTRPQSPRCRNFTQENEYFVADETDECLLSLSDKVNKFTVEQTVKESKPKSTEWPRAPLKEKEPSKEKPSPLERQEPRQPSPVRKTKESSPPKTPETPKSSRSSDAVRKAKALFENIAEVKPEPKKTILKSSPKKPKEITKDVKLTDIGILTTETTELTSTKLLLDSPEKAESPVEKYKKIISEPINKRPGTPKPVKQLNGDIETEVRSVTVTETTRSKSPRKEGKREVSPPKNDLKSPVVEPIIVKKEAVQLGTEEICTTKATKFGVVLKRTDSGKSITSTERRKSNVTDPNHQPCIEDITDLCLLEQMLDKVVGYEQRRRIRAQIRIVKKMVEENKVTITTNKRITSSPIRETTKPTRPSPDRKVPKQQTIKTTYSETTQTIPSTATTQTELSQNLNKTPLTEPVTKSYMRQTITSEKKLIDEAVQEKIGTSKRASSPIKKARSPSPKSVPDTKTKAGDYAQPTSAWISRTTTTTTTVAPQKDFLKKTPTKQKPEPEVDDKPEWVRGKILRKVNPGEPPKRTTARRLVDVKLDDLKAKKEVPKDEISSPINDAEPTSCITSSYGVGPTDENGRPIFGLKALRHQSSFNDKTQVRGTVLSSSYYSENGSEPVGEVTVTQYSNDPSELTGIDARRKNRLHGLTSVTTTQKFDGRTTSPSLTSNSAKENEEIEQKTKTVHSRVTRRGSVKEISKKFIENAVESVRSERTYPKAGLILRTSSFKGDSDVSRASTPGEVEFSKTISLESMDSGSEPKSGRRPGNLTSSFLDSKTRVTGVQDCLTRMKNADVETVSTYTTESSEDVEARSLLNKFLGAQVLMTGMEPIMGGGQKSTKMERRTIVTSTKQESGSPDSKTSIKQFTRPVTLADIENIWDESVLRLLLETTTIYEERRIIRARLRQVMAEQEEERVETSQKVITEGPNTTRQVTTTRVTTQRSGQQATKPMSPFAKFRQLDKQNSLSSSSSAPNSPMTPGGAGAKPMFKFTDPALSNSASTVKERLLYWCQVKTKEYKNVKIDNFSTSWADGLAFCALIHHFRPDAFDYDALTPQQRRHNFSLAFRVADEVADIAPLLDVEDMVMMRKPDWKCVFTYVQSIYRRFKDEEI